MDAKMSSYVILFVCVTVGMQNVSANIPEMTLSTDDGDKKCTRKLTTCSLSLDGLPIMERGEKGERGFPGIQGPVGPPGINGANGEPGMNGMPGYSGPKGDRGENGEMGPPGPPGVQGDTGSPGVDGMPGVQGEKGSPGADGKKGPKGSMGPRGLVGPPGSPGMNGVSGCSLPPNTGTAGDGFDERNEYWGKKDSPADVPCKSAPATLDSGIYYFGSIEQPLEVYCNMTSQETCIRRNEITGEFNFNASKGAFWLNEMNVHMKALYSNITAEYMEWLRARATNVRETLKYNCLDSVPYPKDNVSLSVKLWAWNDVLIGLYPTAETPIFYTVPEATDHCTAGSTKWESTIIELQSSNVYRLPIVDMWIGDVRNDAQKMTVESVELCFR